MHIIKIIMYKKNVIFKEKKIFMHLFGKKVIMHFSITHHIKKIISQIIEYVISVTNTL